MPASPHLIIPLICGFVYVVGTLFMKRAAEHGVGVWRSTFVCNVSMAISFVPLWFLGGHGVPWALWWQPAASGFFFTLAQVFIFLALSRGDVSVTTPVMGTKSVWVALLGSAVFGTAVSGRLWWAAALGAVAVLLLSRSGSATEHRRTGMTIGLTTAAALSFALADVMLQQWAPAWGTGHYLPVMFAAVGIYSLAFIPLFAAPLRDIDREAWRWLAPGSILLALNNVGFAVTIAHWGAATAANILYSSRGLWSVVIVWAVGHWWGNKERQVGRGILFARLAGAALMVAAIVLVLGK